jgi:hypothetical protein
MYYSGCGVIETRLRSMLINRALYLILYSDSKPTAATSISAISRFLVDQDQHPPVGLGPVQTQDEAKAAKEARMLEILRAFDSKFGSGNQAPGN